MMRLSGPIVLVFTFALCVPGTVHPADVDKESDDARSNTAFDTVTNDFEAKGPFGAVVKVGYHKTDHGIRFGAAAHIGVSADSYDKFRFAIYVVARDEKGEVVKKHASIMSKAFVKADSHKWGVYTTHEKPTAGTYTVTATLVAIAKDGSVMILDQGKTTTYTAK